MDYPIKNPDIKPGVVTGRIAYIPIGLSGASMEAVPTISAADLLSFFDQGFLLMGIATVEGRTSMVMVDTYEDERDANGLGVITFLSQNVQQFSVAITVTEDGVIYGDGVDADDDSGN